MKFRQFRELVNAFGPKTRDMKSADDLSKEKIKVIMTVILSIVLIAAGLYVILFGNYPEDTHKWAAGWIGLVAGYWIK